MAVLRYGKSFGTPSVFSTAEISIITELDREQFRLFTCEVPPLV